MPLWERAQVQEVLRRQAMSTTALISRAGPAVTRPPIGEKYAPKRSRRPLKRFRKGLPDLPALCSALEAKRPMVSSCIDLLGCIWFVRTMSACYIFTADMLPHDR
jgi:hypothetical protein